MNKMLCFLIFLCYNSQRITCNKNVKVNFTINAESYNLVTFFGTPPIETFLEIRLDVDFTYCFFNRRKKDNYSSTLKNISYEFIQIKGGSFTGYKSIDVLQNDDFYIKDYCFYYFLAANNSIYDTFSLSYKYRDSKMSIVEHLYNNGEIPQKTFGFYQHDLLGKVLYFGDLPNEVSNIFNYSVKCQVIENNNSFGWNLKLSKVKFQNYTFYSSAFSELNVNINEIYAPREFIDFLINHFFERKILKNYCSLIFSKNRERKIRCERHIELLFPNITFVFDDNEFTIGSKSLFKTMLDRIYFQIIENTYNNQWIFGILFMDQFATLFNYDDKSITFYSEYSNIKSNKLNIVKGDQNKKEIILLYIINIFLVIGVVFLIFQYKYLRNFTRNN